MALENYTLVAYSGTDVGAIYLEDIGKRKQLGGGDQAVKGQDIVINAGDKIALVNAGGVVISSQLGILKTWSTANSEKVAAVVVSKGGTVYRNSGFTGGNSGLNGGITGLAAPLSLMQAAGATGAYSGLTRSGITGASKKADPAVTQGDF